MIANPAVRNIIREGKTHQLDAVIQTGAEEGMQTMDRNLATLVKSGKITLEEAKGYAIDVKELERLVHG
jgi:twitching motility protein PilT